MTEVEPTWGRDVGVLKAIYAALQDREYVDAAFSREATQLDNTTLYWAISALANAGYLKGTMLGPASSSIHVGRGNMTERGRRTVGVWPGLEQAPSVLIAAVNRAAEEERDPERQQWLKDLAHQWSGPAAVNLLIRVLEQTGLFP